MTTPAVVGFTLVTPPLLEGEPGCVALLTVEYGPILIAGIRYSRNFQGEYYLQPPRTKYAAERIHIRPGKERKAILAQAGTMLRTMRPAVPPLATAPESTESDE